MSKENLIDTEGYFVQLDSAKNLLLNATTKKQEIMARKYINKVQAIINNLSVEGKKIELPTCD